MGNEPLRNPKHEAFAQNLAAGKSKREAAILAGYAESNAAPFGTYLAKSPKISQRIAFLQAQVAETKVLLACKELELSVRSKAKRVEIYEDVHERFWQIIKERAADPAMENVPGGRSGMLVKQVKIVGTAEGPKVVSEYVPDTGLSKEIRAILQQAAEELGQWKGAEDQPKPDKIQFCWVAPEPVADEKPPALEEKGQQLLLPAVKSKLM